MLNAEPSFVEKGLCCSKTCRLGWEALGEGGCTMLLQVGAALLKMHDSPSDLPQPPAARSPAAFSAFPQRLPAHSVSPLLCHQLTPRLPANKTSRGLAAIQLLPSVPCMQQMDRLDRGPEQRPISALDFDELSVKPISRASSVYKQMRLLPGQQTDDNGVRTTEPLLP